MRPFIQFALVCRVEKPHFKPLSLARVPKRLLPPDLERRLTRRPGRFNDLTGRQFEQCRVIGLEDAPSSAAGMGLKSVSHFSTFQKAADRLLAARHAQKLLDDPPAHHSQNIHT
jgi:hypothetical protein